MKVVAVLLVLMSCVAWSSQQPQASSRLDGIDVDAILANKRILRSYINCFLDQGPCTPEGREAKKMFPMVVKTNCARCTDSQKRLLKKTVRAFQSKNPKEWQQIIAKYDPDHKREKVFMKFINED